MELLPLVCLCLLSWSGTTSADHHERVVVKQDDDAVLKCSIDGSNFENALFDWKKDGQTEVFLYDAGSHYNNGRTGQDEQFKGRVSHFQDELKHGNASIKIRNAKMADSGDYTCDVSNPTSKIVHVELVVEPVIERRPDVPAPRPYVKTLDHSKTSALLQCEAHGVPDLEVHWQDSAGNKLTAEEPQVSERGDLVYITLKTTVTKTDRFYCVATQENLRHTISAEVYVSLHEPVIERRPDVRGAASRPYIKIIDQTQDGVLLQCEGRGFPKPKVEWKDSSGNILPAEEPQVKETGGSYDITLQATVTKAGNYRCVITQEEIKHQISAETYVPLNEPVIERRPDVPAPKPSVTILHQTDDWAQLHCEAHGVPDLDVKWQDSDGNILAEERQVSGSDRKYITLLTTVTKTGNFSCVATQENLSHRISSQIYVHINKDKPQTPLSAVIRLVVCTIFGILLVVAVVHVLYKRYTKRKHDRDENQPEEEPMNQQSQKQPDQETEPALPAVP